MTKTRDRTAGQINKLLKEKLALEQKMFDLLEKKHQSVSKAIEEHRKKQEVKK